MLRQFRSRNTPKSNRRTRKKIAGSGTTRRLLGESLEPRQLMAAYINEVHFSPLFGDVSKHQYVELRGDALASMSAGTYLVVIGSSDGVHELGDIHTIFNLSNQQFGANGTLVLLQSAANFTVDPASRVLRGTDGFVGMPDSVFSADAGNSSKQIRTGSITFLLIQSNVPPLLSNDIDQNDDGTPDGAYLNWTILDGFTAFPWVENVWPQKAYAPIVFQQDGVGSGMPGATLVRTEELAYVGRIGSSTGYSANDWVAGNTTEDGNGTWNFQLEDGIFGVPRPRAYAGRHLDHIGGPNWVGSISGSVFVDLNSDGIKQAGEAPLPGVRVVSDLTGDNLPDIYAESIEPNDYVLNRDLTNISRNATITTAGTDNLPINFNILVVQKSGSPVGQHIFSHSGVGFFNEIRRLRTDFYRPARSISINVIGNSSSSATYGRLEIFNAADQSLGFVRTAPLGADQVQRLTMTSANDEIAWAVAYSEDSHLSSSPFGMLDHLSFELAEQSTVTDAQGNYFMQPMTRGNYSIYVVPPSNYDQVFPSGGAHAITIQKYESYIGRNFGFLGDLPPVINDQSFNVSEASVAGSVVGVLQFTKGYPSQVLTASITSGDPTGLFAINASNGNITLNRAELDFETKSNYSITVRLADSANAALNDSATINLQITDANEPPVVQAASKLVAENSPSGTLVTTMTAVDPDAGAAGQFNWSIASGNTGSAFAIDVNSGAVRVNDATKIDFEANSQFNLTIRATDRGVPARTGDANLEISLTNVNEAPALLGQVLTIKENSASGVLLGTINAIDPDSGDSLQWQIVGGSGAALFQIAADAKVTVSSGALLDYEQTKQYDLIIKATDLGSLSDSRTYSVSVQDVNEAPQFNSASSFSLKEDASAGTVVGVLTATDPDAGQQLTYSISGSAASRFTVDATSGQIKVANGATFDFETTSTLSLNVKVADNGVPEESVSSVVSLQITNVNEAPSILSTRFDIAENTPPGTNLEDLSASDPDAGDVLTYEIVQQTVNWLSIDSATGTFKVLAGASIDFETLNLNTVTVRVTDAAGLKAERNVEFDILDRNDAPSVANPPANRNTFAEQLFSYTVPTDVFADQDAGDSLRYGVTDGDGFPLPGWLTFNASSGVLSGTPTLSDVGKIVLKLTAIDSQGASASTMFDLMIATPFTWYNAAMPLNVNPNKDQVVSPLDAILIINYLNSSNPRKITPGSAPTFGYLDTSKDNLISAIDVLLVINQLNKRGDGEGESALPTRPQADPVGQQLDWSYIEQMNDRKRQEELIELLASGRDSGKQL